MTEKVYIITNKAKYNIGFHKFNGIEVNVAPNKSVALTENDIVNEAQCMVRWLTDGVLYCADEDVYKALAIDHGDATVAMTDKEIEEKLKLPMKQFGAWLDEQKSEAVKTRVFEVACNFDGLSVKKMEMIESATGFSVTTARKIGNK